MFLVPITVIDDIENILNLFWWGQSSIQRYPLDIVGASLCKKKMEEWGLKTLVPLIMLCVVNKLES
jgi:hypothetical protein